jgi:K+-sensing histidine kinase KdpD
LRVRIARSFTTRSALCAYTYDAPSWPPLSTKIDRESAKSGCPSGSRPGELREADLSVGQWVSDHQEPAGLGTGTLPGTAIHYPPLRAPLRTRGVLAPKPRNERLIFVPEQQRLLETFAAQISLALERVHFVEIAQETESAMASERLRNSLLASISHDLRTPLAVIAGAASSLAEEHSRLTPAVRQGLARTIFEESMQMSELTANVLDMARLDARTVHVNRQRHPHDEVAGAVLSRMRKRLDGRLVEVNLDEAPALVQLDCVLVGQVLANLIDNALKYTPHGTPIELHAGFDAAGCGSASPITGPVSTRVTRSACSSSSPVPDPRAVRAARASASRCRSPASSRSCNPNRGRWSS